MTYVILSTQVWTDNWVSKHWIAHWLAELGHEVYFVEPLRALLPGRRGRVQDLFAGPRIRREGKVQVVSISSLPFYYRIPSALRPIWRRVLRRQFRAFSRRLEGRPFDLITFDGRSLPLLAMLPKPRTSAYYCVDPVGVGEDMRRSETQLVHDVDRVIAISEACKAALERDTGRTDIVVIPHGIDFKGTTSSAKAGNAWPKDLPKTGPVIGYTGSIHDTYVDFDKLEKAASENPGWTFVLVGPYVGSDIAQDASARIGDLMRLPNLHFLGSKPYQELRSYIEHFDVCLIPYRADIDNGWEKRSPVKVLHYLCLGKPVVCAHVPGVSAYKDVIYRYADYAGFVDAIRAGLQEGPKSDLSHRRMELARSRDCDLIIQKLIAALR
jgi:glycosyltransferase involved in cell wall biosynthesis